MEHTSLADCCDEEECAGRESGAQSGWRRATPHAVANARARKHGDIPLNCFGRLVGCSDSVALLSPPAHTRPADHPRCLDKGGRRLWEKDKKQDRQRQNSLWARSMQATGGFLNHQRAVGSDEWARASGWSVVPVPYVLRPARGSSVGVKCEDGRGSSRPRMQQRRGLGMVGMYTILLSSLLKIAAGGHYRSATMSWERVGGLASHTVDITLRTAWSTEFTPFKDQSPGGVVQVGGMLRIQGIGNPVLFFGDGDESYEMVNTKVVAVDPIMKVWRGEAVVRHTYASAHSWVAHFGGCCRDSNVANSAKGYFNISTSVNLLTNATRSPQFAILPRQYLRAGLFDIATNSFVVGAYDSGLHPNEAARGRVSGLRFAWHIVSMQAVVSPMMAGDTVCCNSTATRATTRGMHMESATGRVYGAANEGLFYLHIAVTDTETSVYSEVDFEVAVLAYNATMPEFQVNFSQAILDVPSVNELYATYSYDYRVRFIVPGASLLTIHLETSVLPTTASLPRDTQVILAGGYRAYQSALRWDVTSEQVGWHVFCLQAYTNESVPGIGGVASRTHCLEFDVTLDPPPRFSQPGVPRTTVSVYMGEDLRLTVEALDDNQQDVIAIEAHNLPQGTSITPVTKDSSVQINTVKRNMTWVPHARAGGDTGSFCFTASDLRGTEGGPGGGSAQVCYDYAVPKCLYRVRAGEALVDVAEKFSTSWLQLWALNKDIRRPEGHSLPGSIQEGYIIHIGQLVLVRAGDTLDKLAARFGTTLRQILNLNRDITSSKTLVPGQLICLVPSSCMERQ